MGNGFRTTPAGGVAAPPYTNGPYTFSEDITFEGDLTVEGDFTFGDATTDTLTVEGAAQFNTDVTMTFAGTENLNIVNTTLGSGTKGIYVEMEPGSATAGSRQGALHIEMGRSVVMTASDGNPDTALKITNSDWSDAGSGYARIRGMDIKAQNDGDNGNSSVTINTIYATAECATGMANSGTMTVAQFNMKNNGTITGESTGIIINDESQGTVTGDTIALRIGSSAYAITREHAIEIGSGGGSWTNIIHFTDDDHTNLMKFDVVSGCISVDAGATGANSTHKIKVDVNGTAAYIALFADY